MRKNIILFGSNSMAEEYLKVLRGLDCNVNLIGRDKNKAQTLAAKYKVCGFGGGVDALGKINSQDIDLVIIASAVESLKEITIACINKGYKNILIEKPGALDLNELIQIKNNISKGLNLRIAYNRRFYNSVLMLENKIEEDAGVLACFFDFTEREKDLVESTKSKEVIKRWGFTNSTHVIDAVFFLIGLPLQINVLMAGFSKEHPSGNTFVGSGMTQKCLFSYFASWAGGGRWGIEVSTNKGRYKLCPLEELYFCKKNQFLWENIKVQDKDDEQYKPGLYKMVKQILIEKNFSRLPDINEQINLCKIVNKIFNYEN